MSKSDTNCIKYLLNEMDPSEKFLFERELQCNSDLLIEVESLRSINNRLKSIPHFTPPEYISESVIQYAANNPHSSRQGFYSGFMLAAALLFLAVTVSIFLIDNPTTAGETAGTQASMNSGMLLFQNESSEQETERIENIKPWVDRNEVLYFTGSSGQSQSAIENSFQKLQPVNNERATRSLQRNLHLTGSSN